MTMRFPLSITIIIAFLLSLSGCEAVDNFFADLLGIGSSEEENSVQEDHPATPLAAEEAKQEQPRPEVALSSEPGDELLGWSEDYHFFAFRQRHVLVDGDVAYSLHIINANIGKPTGGVKGVLTVSSNNLSLAPSANVEAETIMAFNAEAEPILLKYNYPEEPQRGKVLFDNGSFADRFGKSALPANQEVSIQISGLEDTRLLLATHSEKLDPNTVDIPYTIRSSFELKLVAFDPRKSKQRQAPIRKAKNKDQDLNPGAIEHVLSQGIFKVPGISGYWMKCAQLSPDDKRLVVLVESYSNEKWTGRNPGRMEIIAAATNIKRPDKEEMMNLIKQRFGKGKPLPLNQNLRANENKPTPQPIRKAGKKTTPKKAK